jgi:hypothetical protein
LKKALIARYGGRRLENPFEELSTLRQTGNVEEFVEAFELLSSQVGRLPEEQYLGYFMSGLKPAIRRRVRTLNPSNRMQMMRMAKDVEEELREDDDDVDREVGKKGMGRTEGSGLGFKFRSGSSPIQKELTKSNGSGWSNPARKTFSTGSTSSQTNSNSSMASTGRKSETDRRTTTNERWRGLSSEEIEDRRAKGLCFKCKGKYHPTLHKCPEKSLRVLILGEGEVMNEDGEIVVMEDVSGGGDDDGVEEAECKFMGVLGSMGEYQTMKVEGQIADVGLLVLVDSGASHNFISPKVTSALGLVVTPSAAKSIKLGDGHKVTTRGVCEGVKLKMGKVEIVVDALVLELGGLDMVLGVAWLSTLGEVVMDWRRLTMQFMHEGQSVKLQGVGSTGNNQSYLNSFLKDIQGSRGMEWWSQFRSIEKSSYEG